MVPTKAHQKPTTNLSKMPPKSKLRRFLIKDIKKNQLQHPDGKGKEDVGFNSQPHCSISTHLKPSAFFGVTSGYKAADLDTEVDSIFDGSDTSPPQVPMRSVSYNARDLETRSRWGAGIRIERSEEMTGKSALLRELKNKLENVLHRQLSASARERAAIDRQRVALIRQIALLEAEEEETKVRRKGIVIPRVLFSTKRERWS